MCRCYGSLRSEPQITYCQGYCLAVHILREWMPFGALFAARRYRASRSQWLEYRSSFKERVDLRLEAVVTTTVPNRVLQRYVYGAAPQVLTLHSVPLLPSLPASFFVPRTTRSTRSSGVETSSASFRADQATFARPWTQTWLVCSTCCKRRPPPHLTSYRRFMKQSSSLTTSVTATRVA